MAWLDAHILTIILMCPVVGLGVLMLVPEGKNLLLKQVAAVSSGLSLALSLRVWALFDASKAELQMVERVAWLPSSGINYIVGVDGLSLAMVLLTGIVFFTGVLTMWSSRRPDTVAR